jgi:cytochrome c oxidase subunit II
MKHVVGAIIFIMLLSVFAWGVLNVDRLLPAQASVQALPIDQLFNLQFKLVAILFGLIMGLILYSVVFFRRKPGDVTDGPHITGNTPLEIAWTVIPFTLVIGLSLIGSHLLGDTLRIDPQALEINVTGQQWSWRFEYPEYGLSTDELYLPLNKQVLLKLSSTDVIHSFWVPEFRVKADAVPGIVNELRVTPSKLGEYSLICSEICGRGHAFMKSVVKVVSEQDFQAWIAERQVVTDDPVARGHKWVKQFGCLSCHSYDGSENIGPTFKGLYGKQEKLEDGTTVKVDDVYLIEAIRYPGKDIVRGFGDIMPSDVAAALTDEQIQDIIAYMATLK